MNDHAWLEKQLAGFEGILGSTFGHAATMVSLPKAIMQNRAPHLWPKNSTTEAVEQPWHIETF